MTLYQIYEIVNYISGKFSSGYAIPPARFNILLPQVQDELYLTLLNGVIAAADNEQALDIILSTTPLIPFKKTGIVDIDPAGSGTLPDDYYRYFTVYSTEKNDAVAGISVTMIRRLNVVSDDMFIKKQGDVFTRADVNPFAKIISKALNVVPYDMGRVSVGYFRKPAVPYMDFAQDGLNPNIIRYLNVGNSIEVASAQAGTFQIYKDEQASAAGDDPLFPNVFYSLPASGGPYRSRTVELEWEPLYHEKFVYLILAKCGINLGEGDVTKFAMEMSQ